MPQLALVFTRSTGAAAGLLAIAGAVHAAPPWVAKEICHCYATDLSDDGTAATGTLNGSNTTFYWQAGRGMTSLGRGTYRQLRRGSGVPAISGDGQVVGSTILDETGSFGTQGRWTAETGWQQLMPPRPADGGVVDAEDGSVFGMSRDGLALTGLYWRKTAEGGLAHASRWTSATGVQDLGSGGGSSRVDDADRTGRVLVGWDEHPTWGIRRAAVWLDGVKTLLEPEDSDWPSEAGAVNADGSVIVGQAVDPARQIQAAVKWTWNGSRWVKTLLGNLPHTVPGGSAYANGVSDDGSIVVGTATREFSPSSLGFVWTAAEGMTEAGRYLHQRGIDLSQRMDIFSISAISGDGSVMAAVGTQKSPPFTTRSVAVRTAGSGR
jgi:uncharacterized membrane protein